MWWWGISLWKSQSFQCEIVSAEWNSLGQCGKKQSQWGSEPVVVSLFSLFLSPHPSNSLIIARAFFLILISACNFTCNYLLKRWCRQLHYFSSLSTAEEHRKKKKSLLVHTINNLCQVWTLSSTNDCHLYHQHTVFPGGNVGYEFMIFFGCWL